MILFCNVASQTLYITGSRTASSAGTHAGYAFTCFSEISALFRQNRQYVLVLFSTSVCSQFQVRFLQ